MGCMSDGDAPLHKPTPRWHRTARRLDIRPLRAAPNKGARGLDMRARMQAGGLLGGRVGSIGRTVRRAGGWARMHVGGWVAGWLGESAAAARQAQAGHPQTYIP